MLASQQPPSSIGSWPLARFKLVRNGPARIMCCSCVSSISCASPRRVTMPISFIASVGLSPSRSHSTAPPPCNQPNQPARNGALWVWRRRWHLIISLKNKHFKLNCWASALGAAHKIKDIASHSARVSCTSKVLAWLGSWACFACFGPGTQQANACCDKRRGKERERERNLI